MNKWLFAFLSCICYTQFVYGESFLKASSFPTTFNDLSFSEKMEFKAEDYELYRPIYDDATGNCIENCVYMGLNIKQEQALIEQNTLNALAKSAEYEKQNKKLSVNTQNIISNVSNGAYACTNRNPDILVGQKTPRGEPLVGRPRISSPYAERTLDGKSSFHHAIDYAVPVGTVVYSPADGTVARIINDSSCGKGVRLKHYDGTQTVYCHLNETLVQQNAVVGAGCPIAKTGNTGHSTGPHLHYAVHDSDNKPLVTWRYTGRNN